MKKISRRAVSALLISVAIIFGLAVFIINYFENAATWATYPADKHVYTDGVLASGKILDRTGQVLYSASDGLVSYNNSATIRKATLHAVGDMQGNISTSVQKVFGSRLIGYDLLNGVYSLSNEGSSLYLTLDADVCAAALKALNGRSGTVGVYNYKTGEIICMVSSPTFDPEDPPDLEEDDTSGVYLNRFISSSFVPGSIFKLVTAAAAIDNIPDIFEREFTCTGSLEIDGGLVTCPKAHGTITFEEALASSCNCTFAQIALELGPTTLKEYASRAGFGTGTTISGISTAAGNFDLDGSSDLDLGWAGVGQYTDMANPCTMMTFVGAIANDGVPVIPQLISKVTTGGLTASSYSKITGNRMLSSETAQKLADMMHNNVVANYGVNNYPGLDLCAKSGTAEVGDGKSPNAWFVGFIRNEDYPLAFVVLVENGGAGSSVAGPIANTVLQAAIKALS